MSSFNLHYAKTHLSRLVQRAMAGEEVVIARAGAPLVRLTPLETVQAARVPGRDRGKVVIHDDFDAPTPELEKLFHDGSDPA